MASVELISQLGLRVLSFPLGFKFLRKRVGAIPCFVVNYHSVAGLDMDPDIRKNTYRDEAQLNEDFAFFCDHFTPIGVLDLIDSIKEGTRLPEYPLLITFDDGLKVNYSHHVPILKKYGLTATFFLNNDFIDNEDLHYKRKINYIRRILLNTSTPTVVERIKRYLSDQSLLNGDILASIQRIEYRNKHHLERLSDLAGIDFKSVLKQHQPYLNTGEIQSMIRQGFTFGAHSLDHPDFADLSLDEQVHQTVKSIEGICQNFGLSYRLFAFPHRDHAVSAEYFENIRPYVDVSFGTKGFIRDSIDFHIQRTHIEDTGLATKSALKYRFLGSVFKRLLKKT